MLFITDNRNKAVIKDTDGDQQDGRYEFWFGICFGRKEKGTALQTKPKKYKISKDVQIGRGFIDHRSSASFDWHSLSKLSKLWETLMRNVEL